MMASRGVMPRSTRRALSSTGCSVRAMVVHESENATPVAEKDGHAVAARYDDRRTVSGWGKGMATGVERRGGWSTTNGACCNVLLSRVALGAIGAPQRSRVGGVRASGCDRAVSRDARFYRRARRIRDGCNPFMTASTSRMKSIAPRLWRDERRSMRRCARHRRCRRIRGSGRSAISPLVPPRRCDRSASRCRLQIDPLRRRAVSVSSRRRADTPGDADSCHTGKRCVKVETSRPLARWR